MSEPERPGAEAPILGIETSCDETSAAVVRSGRVVRSLVVASQVALHAPYGGVFPEIASRQHVRDVAPVIAQAMKDAGIGWDRLAAVAVTYGPGLAGSLLVGVNAAKGLAVARGLPLVGVNHLEGHLYSNWLHDDGELRTEPGGAAVASDTCEPRFPYLALIVSGGHTELVHVRGHGRFVVLGSTLDDAAGEAFDKAARMLGLPYPGGPALELAAATGDPAAFALPVADTAWPLDFSFSGLKTALLRIVTATPDLEALRVADLAASYQAAVVRALVLRVVRALCDWPASEVQVAGGVSANQCLRQALGEAVDVPVRHPPLVLCTDNAAMIAAAAHWQLVARRTAGLALDVEPGLRLESRLSADAVQ